MQRTGRRARRARTYAAGAALALALSGGLTTACTGGGGDGGAADSQPGDAGASASHAPPGKYRTLPEPCGAVSVDTLKDLLPGAATTGTGSADPGPDKGPDGPSASPYRGEPSLTYDTDRRVGCRWKASTSLATRHLSVDLERVVSYDPAVSDDNQAETLYKSRADRAGIPGAQSASPGGGGTGDAGGDATPGKAGKTGKAGRTGRAEEGDKESGGGKGTDGGREKSDSPGGGATPSDSPSTPPKSGDDASSTPPTSDDTLGPRVLDDIGDNAYIDDKLDTDDSGVHRDITLVFRSANVIATVRYDEWLADKSHTPDSAELQKMARTVAKELAADFDDE